MNELELYRNLSLNNNFSKSEMNVFIFCRETERTAREITSYLEWQAPNVARLLVTMHKNGMLNRRQLDDNRTYVYISNFECPLLNNK